MTTGREPTDAQLWWSVRQTLIDVILPALDPGWPRSAAIQLVGIADYARTRPPDPTSRWTASLAETLERIGAPVDGELADDVPTVYARCGDLLAGAVGAEDEAAESIRHELRPVLVSQLDEDLDVTSSTIPSFRGSLPGG